MAGEGFIADLGKSHDDAQRVALKIAHALKTNYIKLETKEATRYQLKYCVQVLRHICIIVSKTNDTHYDVFSGIVKQVLQPTLQPASSPSHWTRYLDNLRYLYNVIIQKKRYTEAAKIFDSVTAQSGKLQSEKDYKPIMSIYNMHLLAQRARLHSNPERAYMEIGRAVNALIELFIDMLEQSKVSNLLYPELMDDFVQQFCKNVHSFAMLTKLTLTMYQAFFALLSGMKMAPFTVDAVGTLSQRHLAASLALIQMDVLAKLRHPVALLHLRACCDMMRALQSDSHYPGQAFVLFHDYVQLAYAQDNIADFSKSYTRLCGKFTDFFKRAEEEGAVGDKWFMDFVVVFTLLLLHVHQRASPCFAVFWQQMESVECYAEHLKLLLTIIKLAPYITESELAPWTCCNSVRKHTILQLTQSALASFSNCVQLRQLAAAKPDGELAPLQHTLAVIVRHGLNVIGKMSCIASNCASSQDVAAAQTPNDLRMFYAHFAQLMRDVRTAQQAHFCIGLAEHFTKIRTMLAPIEWENFLRRLYKTAALTADAVVVGELHSYVVAAMLQQRTLDWGQLRYQLAIYYCGTAAIATGPTSATITMQERWLLGKRAVRPALDAQQQRLFHWLEAQYLCKYHKSNEPLQQSLLRSADSAYERIQVLRQMKFAGATGTAAAVDLASAMRAKGAVRQRLDNAVLAHACTMLLQERCEERKRVADIGVRACFEDNLEALLLRDDLYDISLARELCLVDLAEEALHAFEQFYALADAEFIDMDAHLNWELLNEDLSALALYLHYAGYMELATRAWLLHYRIANMLSDQYSILRALAYFCEHAEHFEGDAEFNLDAEVRAKQTVVLAAVQQRAQLRRREQGCLLLCLCQLAYYHGRAGHLAYMEALLRLVYRLHGELPERCGKYDLVMITCEVVRSRILWKHAGLQRPLLLQQSLLRNIELTMEHLREFVFVSQSDTMPYMTLLFTFSQQIAECASNRLYDHNMISLLSSVLRMALQAGTALRIIQILTAWMWANLQMEYVQKAQVKLRLIEFVMGTKSARELQQQAAKLKSAASSSSGGPATTQCASDMQSLQVSLEAVRKVVPAHASPLRVEKFCLSPGSRRRGLQHFLRGDSCDMLQKSELLQWCYFAVGCLNARLSYLIADYEQLDEFYAHCQRWLQQRSHSSQRRYFAHFQLLCAHHHVNYLRARGQHEAALERLESALAQALQMAGSVDSMYRINLELQRYAIRSVLQQARSPASEKVGRVRLCRTLTFNTSFDEYMERCNSRPPPPLHHKAKALAFSIYHSDDEPDFAVADFAKSLHPPSKSQVRRNQKPPAVALSPDELNLCQAIQLIDLDNSSQTAKALPAEQSTRESEAAKPLRSKRKATPELAICILTPGQSLPEHRATRASEAECDMEAVETTAATSVKRGRRRQPTAVAAAASGPSLSTPPARKPTTRKPDGERSAPYSTAATARPKKQLLRQKGLCGNGASPNGTPTPTPMAKSQAGSSRMTTRLRRRRESISGLMEGETNENVAPLNGLSGVMSRTNTVTPRRRQRT